MILYKKDSSGKIRFIEVLSNKDKVIQRSGVVGSENIVEREYTAKAKNIGRSNETTEEQQAILEAQSKYDTKLTEGYFKTIKEAEDNEVILPMLAKDYHKEKKKVDWKSNVYVQPKLDGMRAMWINGKFISRKGKVIDTIPHLDDVDFGDKIIDGELYAHGLSFQDNMRLIKKYRPGESENIQFRVYDLVANDSYENRLKELMQVVKSNTHSRVSMVFTALCYDEDKLKEFHSKFLAEQYEGTMIRHSDDGYALNKRSSSLLKYKDFYDLPLVIKDVVPNDKNPEHGSFIFDWRGAKGHPNGDHILGCGMKFSHEERAKIMKHPEKYIGKTAELRFFEYSDTGVPRFPVCVGIRLDK